ncbi:MAG: hypothetical protein ABI889_04220 [Gemmatimonadota bacterium]
MMLQIQGDRFPRLSGSMPTSVTLQQRVTDDYQASYEAAGDAVGSWSDVADNLDGWPLAPFFAAGALALLLKCARGAASAMTASRCPTVVAGSAMGSVIVATVLLKLLGLPGLGIRAIAFAVCVSFLAARFAIAANRNLTLLSA